MQCLQSNSQRFNRNDLTPPRRPPLRDIKLTNPICQKNKWGQKPAFLQSTMSTTALDLAFREQVCRLEISLHYGTNPWSILDKWVEPQPVSSPPKGGKGMAVLNYEILIIHS